MSKKNRKKRTVNAGDKIDKIVKSENTENIENTDNTESAESADLNGAVDVCSGEDMDCTVVAGSGEDIDSAVDESGGEDIDSAVDESSGEDIDSTSDESGDEDVESAVDESNDADVESAVDESNNADVDSTVDAGSSIGAGNRIKWFSVIRVYGLLLVLGYHLFYKWFPGGFLGVDIFFTFSGYLITALIFEELRGTGKFALFSFIKRRFRRIFIPLFCSILFTLPFMLLISPDFTVGIVQKVTSALSFVINWAEIQSGGSYEAQMLPSVYIHTWSLAIEMQFYLVWGAIVAAIAAIVGRVSGKDAGKNASKDNNKDAGKEAGKNAGKNAGKDSGKYTGKQMRWVKALILVVSGGAAVFSYLLMRSMYDAGQSPDAIYFNSLARMLPFAAGSFAAAICGMREKDRQVERRRPGISAAALITAAVAVAALIFYGVLRLRFTDGFVYRYGFAIVSVLTVALIFCMRGLHYLTPEKTVEPFLLRAGADLSYSAYLYHWPFYVVFSAILMSNTIASLITLGLTFAFSAFTYYVIERLHIRAGHTGELRHKRVFTGAAAVLSLAAVPLCLIVFFNAPMITSIENDFASGYIISDAGNIESLQRMTAAINDSPVRFNGDVRLLQANVLSELTVPDTVTSEPTVPEPSLPDFTLPDSAQPNGTVDYPDFGLPVGVTIIGDSVSLGAQATLLKSIPDSYMDAEVSRSIKAGYRLMIGLRDKKKLREYVVIALGANENRNYASLFTQIIDDLPPGHRLIFVTPFIGRKNEAAEVIAETAAWMRELPEQYDYVTIADWHELISTQADLLAGDKTHMGGPSSRALYTDCIMQALETAAKKPPKLE